ncbi:GHMP kinase N terminal domain protein, partial [Vibrio parahaemolyticus V-223/04]
CLLVLVWAQVLVLLWQRWTR